jgi:hypothetical protein
VLAAGAGSTACIGGSGGKGCSRGDAKAIAGARAAASTPAKSAGFNACCEQRLTRVTPSTPSCIGRPERGGFGPS